MLKPLLREPLVHFLLLGALLFALDATLRPQVASQVGGSTEIVVSEARIASLAQNFRRTWQRPPTKTELEGLIESHIKEEVMVREALALGLDRDDAIIRRRLQQKMEFVAEEAAASPPTDAELAKYLADHAEAFRVDPVVTFAQVYLDRSRRGAALPADAARLLDALNAQPPADPANVGDALQLLEPRYDKLPQAEVARLFGQEFTAALLKQPPGRWAGPIDSGYGAHLVRVETLTAGRLPALDEVRPLVEREWVNARRQEQARATYERLRAKYRIQVQMPGPLPAASARP